MTNESSQQPQSPKKSAPPPKPYGDKPNTGGRPQDPQEPATSDPVDGAGGRNPSDRSAANASPGATPKEKPQSSPKGS